MHLLPAHTPYTVGSLFSGIGGIDLAFSLAGFDVLFQVEIDEFCRKVLTKHADQYWPNATQYVDVRAVGGHNLPRVDALFGGFPCQPHSVAGRRLGADDSRNLWPDFRRIIGDLRPRAILLENVPGILTTMGAGVIADLAAMGYVGRAGVIRASDTGAPHQRARWFCVAYTTSGGTPTAQQSGQRRGAEQSREGVADASGARLEKRERLARDDGKEQPTTERGGFELADAANIQRLDLCGGSGEFRPTGNQGQQREADASTGGWSRAGWSTTQPRVCRGPDGLPGGLDFPGWPARPGEPQHEWEPPRVTSGQPNRVARLKALGNAVVPQVVYPIAHYIHEWLQAQDAGGSSGAAGPHHWAP